jgi:hypothetical protein
VPNPPSERAAKCTGGSSHGVLADCVSARTMRLPVLHCAAVHGITNENYLSRPIFDPWIGITQYLLHVHTAIRPKKSTLLLYQTSNLVIPMVKSMVLANSFQTILSDFERRCFDSTYLQKIFYFAMIDVDDFNLTCFCTFDKNSALQQGERRAKCGICQRPLTLESRMLHPLLKASPAAQKTKKRVQTGQVEVQTCGNSVCQLREHPRNFRWNFQLLPSCQR